MLTTEYPSQALSNVIRELDQAVQDHPGMLNAGLVSQAHKLLQDARRANAHEEREIQDTLREGRRSMPPARDLDAQTPAGAG